MKPSIIKSKDELPMFLTVMDMAALLGISRSSAYELAAEEGFPKLKLVPGRVIIHNIKQKIAGDIFRYEMMSVYKKQTEVRDGLKEKFRQRLRELARQLQTSPGEISHEFYQKFSLLCQNLSEHKGKKPVVSLWYEKTMKGRKKLWQNADRKVTARYASVAMGGGKPESLSDTRTTARPCISRHLQKRRKAR